MVLEHKSPRQTHVEEIFRVVFWSIARWQCIHRYQVQQHVASRSFEDLIHGILHHFSHFICHFHYSYNTKSIWVFRKTYIHNACAYMRTTMYAVYIGYVCNPYHSSTRAKANYQLYEENSVSISALYRHTGVWTLVNAPLRMNLHPARWHCYMYHHYTRPTPPSRTFFRKGLSGWQLSGITND